jgi:predicted phage terminase large subunit-like protein
VTDLWEFAARDFEESLVNAANERTWATPGEMARALDPSTRQTPTLDLIDKALCDVLYGRTKKLILATSPQVGKSQRVSRRFPLYALKAEPTLRIALVSATLPLAEKWGRTIRQDIAEHPELGIVLRKDSNSAKRWETSRGGSLFCTGWTSGTVGQPIDLLIIDDPITSRKEAESPLIRERLWEFWENDAGTRARKAIVMATRWHKLDLSGQLLEKEPGQWVSLSIPAISEGGDDPLGRPEGVELESANPDLHPPGFFYDKQKTTSSYVWNSLYQQRPSAAEGNIFKRDQWRYWELAPQPDGRRFLHLRDEQYGRDDRYDLADCSRFITIDLAASTRTSADYTVAAAWAITLDGDLVCLDRVRARVPEMDHAEFIRPLRTKWLGPYDVVHIEKSMQTSTLIYALGRSGVPTAPLEADVNKLTRALPYAGLVRQGKVWLPADADWHDSWIDEHADFNGNGKQHDDQVDAGAYAARVAIAHWLPPMDHAEELARKPAPDPEYVDLMSANF